MERWTEEARFGWLAFFSQENCKNANKMYSDASGCRQIQHGAAKRLLVAYSRSLPPAS